MPQREAGAAGQQQAITLHAKALPVAHAEQDMAKVEQCYHHGYTIPSGMNERCTNDAVVKIVGSRHYKKLKDSYLYSCDKHIDPSYGHMITNGYHVVECYPVDELRET